MDGLLLDICGAVAIVMGGWRSYAVARQALGPLAHQGDPTRTEIEAARPLLLRPRVRLFARRLAVSVGWLAIAFYGLYLLARGQGVPG
jgi:uracil-DNA glycosylase